MSPEIMTLPQSKSRLPNTPVANTSDPSTRAFIEAARAQPAPMRAALAAGGLTSLLAWASFTPLNISPLGWVCLVPFILLARIERPTRLMYLATYLTGLAFWLPTLQWMRLGHVTMYTAWLALAVYMAAYFPVCLGLTRVAVHRFRIPLAIAFPVVWVGLELVRGHLLTGFGWYFLGHTQYRWLELIQISDVVGAYGVSFVMAMMSACVALIIPPRWLAKLQLLPPNDASPTPQTMLTIRARGILLCLSVFVAVVGYGYWRRSAADFDQHPAPKIAAVQTNATSEVKHNPKQVETIYNSLRKLTGSAVLEKPDLIVWPETMFRWPLFEVASNVSPADLEKNIPRQDLEFLRGLEVKQNLHKLSQMADAAMVIGLETVAVDQHGMHTYNSAAFVSPDRGLAGRYDKLHRVPFGEYLPFQESMPWLKNFSPYPPDFGITAGAKPQSFEHDGIRYAPVICFEDTVPHVVRDVLLASEETGVTGKPVDVLLNLTNDGWFHGSSELDQHLITAAFRCVENRTPMVRSVNTGISAIIDGDGAIRSRAVNRETGREKQVEAVLVDHVPLDSRRSLYLAGGDWFAGSCAFCCGFLGLAGLLSRWIPKRAGARHNEG
ncbi:Apolipoprotein N-acyltransferase [Symmachiella macrocystis]|uniref:Apolipoprotein N-acyltransferase n=1 Tax=Symmachiella macrocystis TaxID=2527985 RepID=A0A5C6BN99_9PLAN|nr:apolipoprotein N-acyltransferase [Symmachiella macrocystis]TWU13217.1 Apolipoprotein N-acyltransferase [Symmachiella macrocystis]